MRWLSKGNCLLRLCELYNSVLDFLEDTDTDLADALKSTKCDVAYLADIFQRLNTLNLQLQGDGASLIKSKSTIMSFILKLVQFKSNVGRRELRQFPRLKDCEEVTDGQLRIYCEHLQALRDDMVRRFQDLSKLVIPEWVVDPFTADSSSASIEVQESLIGLQTDEEMKAHFRMMGIESFWAKVSNSPQYSNIWEQVKLLFVAFPSSYLVERGFSAVLALKTKQRNRLNVESQGDLRLYLSSGLQPRVKALAAQHQSQGSH